MAFDVYGKFDVVRYQRAGKDDEPHLAFYQQKLGAKHMLWDGEKQLIVTELEMMKVTPEEAAVFRAKANEEFNKRLFNGTHKPKTQVTTLEAKVSRNTTVEASDTKPHEEEDNMEVVTATLKKPLTDFDILLAGEEDIL
jgi:hypothetical protein